MREYIIALGGNIGDTESVFVQALERIEARIGRIREKSSYHETEPLLHPERPVYGQKNYLNAVVKVSSPVAPEELMRLLFGIERALGRLREKEERRWGPRVIDLDIICCGSLQLSSQLVTIPHPEMHHRRFVLEPMMEIAPNWLHPLLGKTTAALLIGLKG